MASSCLNKQTAFAYPIILNLVFMNAQLTYVIEEENSCL